MMLLATLTSLMASISTFDTLPAAELWPKGAKFAVAEDGSLTVNGVPRYFPATQFYGHIEHQGQPDARIPADEKWFYEGMPNYETLQRLGLDTAGFYGALAWMKRVYRPWFRDEYRDNAKLTAMIENLGMPMYVDMTASEWSHGSLWHADCPLDPKRTVDPPTCKKPGKDGMFCNHPECGAKLDTPGRLSAKAWTKGPAHWMPWSIVYPQGRDIYLNMWENVAKDAIAISPAGNRPWCYELLNEPSCFDESDYAKETFAARMKEKGIDVTDKTVYNVEYQKFMEERFASLLAEGTTRIKALDSEAKTTFQPCTIRTRGIDLYRTYANLDVVCSHTGGRGLVDAAILRGLADGKPIVDNEMYIGNTTNSIRSAYLTQYIRGFNISYSFKYEGAKSGYNFRNPNNVKLDALIGSRLAKRDVMDVNEFFTPRRRGVKHEVAVLFSMPTERIAECAGIPGYKDFDAAVTACAFAHLPFDVIHEDDLVNGSKRLDRYRVLVAAGTRSVYPGTRDEIARWQRETGGRLVALNAPMDLDEYGRPTVCCKPSDPVAKEDFGKRIVAACAEAGIVPTCMFVSKETGKPAVAVETHVARRNGFTAWAINSCAGAGQLVRFKPSASAMLLHVWNQVDIINGAPRVVSYRQVLKPNEVGEYALFLTPGDVQFYVQGDLAALKARYPEGRDVRWLAPLAFSDALKAGRAKLEAEIAARVVEKPAFEVDPNKCHPIDLRKFVNRRFIDKVARDGRDGWVDQGAKFSLEDTPWGVVTCNGVPMEFIRYDQNGYRDCLVMKSTKLVDAPADEMPYPTEVKGIPVEAKAKNIYFLHAVGWGVLGRVETAFTYRFNYEDGTQVEVPCRNFHEVWDWFFVSTTTDMAKARCFKGWANGANRGLYIWQWQNPHPNRRLVSIDILAGTGQQIPLIVAMTREEP